MEEQGYQLFREPSLNPWGIEPPLGYIEQSLPSRMDLAVQGVDIQAIPLTAQSSNPSVFNTAIADPLLGFSSSQSGIASSVLTNDSLLSSPVVVNQEAASFSFASHNTSWVGAPQITQLDNLGEVLVVPGTSSETVSIVVQWTFRDAKYNNEVGVFVVDQSGKVGGLSPSEQGFAQTALQSSTRQTLFNSGHAAGNWRELTFTGGSILAFYLIQNGTSENWLANNPSNTVSQQSLAFFSLLGSNPDGFDHSRSTHLGKGIWRLNWEDLTGGGDQDFNDVVFNIGQPGILLPGQEKQTVPLTVELFDKEATYQNQMGYFLVDAPDGKIGDLLPGDKGYRKAALERHETVFTADGLLSGYQVNLPSAKYLGWYLVSNATATQAINNEQISVFFSYSAANADGLSHLHAQQDSHTWAWEDVFGGGDRDFNDLVFRFDLGEPMGLPTTLPHLSIGNVTVTEGDQGTQDANFAVRLSEASIQTVTAQFATKDDTAKAGEDYEAQMGIVSFAPGELEKTISVKVTGDRLQELTENFKVNLANANNALITQGVGTGTILENDNLTPLLPSLSIGDVTVTEGDEGTQKANFAVRLSQASEQTVTAEFVTEDDTAKNSEDYEAQTGIITFAPGEVEKMIAVNIKGDRRYELTESFKVNLANAKNALISQGTGIVTILDNDPLPTITVQNTSIVEGDGEPTKAEFEISLSEATSVHVTVEYETLDGTAKVGEDYQSNVGSLTFAPGETRRFIDVPIVGDLVNEADEVFTLRLKNPTNSTLGNSEAQGTIINDDAGNKAPSALGLTPTTVNENIPNNSAIAEFSTVDINVGDTHSYQLVKGDGDLDNNAFAIVGNGLQIKQSPNFEEKAIYQIRVRTTDQDGLFLEKAFTINIADINEAPTVINLSNNSLSENIPANSLVGTINGQDPDAGDSLIYELVNNLGGEDNGSFTLISNELRLKDSPNFEAKSSYNLRIKAIDKGSLSLEKNFVIQITDVNEAPFFISQPILTAEVGTAYQYEIKAQDPDTNDILTISAIQNPLNWTKTDTSNGVSLLSQIPTINDIGQHIFEWKVQDSAGLIATQNYTLAVSALLKEANNFSPSLQKVITIPATPTILQFKIEGLSFDQTDTNSIKDAFEVELVDAQGNSLVHTIGSDKTAFFNITEGLTASLAPGVTYDANTGIIRVNLVGVQPNTTGNLILRLVNNDQDTATQVRITDITLENAPPGTVAPVATPAILALQSVANPPNLTNLVDVTGSMEVQYQRTTLNEDTNLVYADFNLKNIGSYGVNTNLLVAIKNISDPTVQVRETDGVTLEGLPYYDFTDLLINGKLDFNQVTNSRSLVFFNPNQVQFTYDVVVLAVVNRNPIIQTQPELEIIGGQAYQYDVNAVDADLDNLSYRLLVAPQGMTIDAVTGLINWQTATTNIGNQVIKVEVTDGRGGFAQQSYTLSVIDTPPNRPPIFTSNPVVDAYINQLYQYDANAIDPDKNYPLTYNLVIGPDGMTINQATGEMSWTPPAALLLGDTVLGRISLPGENSEFTFSGMKGQRIYFDPLQFSGNYQQWRVDIYSPSNRKVVDGTYLLWNNNQLFTLEEDGNYRVVVNPQGEQIGTYGFSLIESSLVPANSLDTVIQGTLSPGSEDDLYRFTANKGQKLYFDKLSQNGTLGWVLYNSANQVVASDDNFNDMEVDLAVDGEYILALRGNSAFTSTVNYAFTIITPDLLTNPLTLGATVEGAISEKGEQDTYTFTGTAGQQLFFDSLGSDFFYAYLYDPTGRLLWQHDSRYDRGTNNGLVFTVDGNYKLVIDGGRDQDSYGVIGNYKFRLLNKADATVINLDTDITGTFDNNGIESDSYRFTLTDTTYLYFDGQLGNYDNAWILYGSGGQYITSRSFYQDDSSDSYNDTELWLDSGEYWLILQGNSAEYWTGGNNDYKLRLVTPEFITLLMIVGTNVNGNINEVGEQDTYTFEGIAGQQLFYDALGGDFLKFRFYDPTGRELFNVDSRSDRGPDGSLTLAMNGTYKVIIDGVRDYTGSYGFRLLDKADATVINLDTDITGTFDNGGIESDSYRFTLTDRSYLYIDGQLGNYDNAWILYNSNGQYITSRNFYKGQNSDSYNDAEFWLESGDYWLILQGNGAEGWTNGSNDYQIRIITPELNTAPMMLGTTITGSIGEVGEQDSYTFEGTAGQQLFYDALGGDFLKFRFFDPTGRELFNVDSRNDRGPDGSLTLAMNGTYKVIIDGERDGIGNYNFRLLDKGDATVINLDTDITGTFDESAAGSVGYRFSLTERTYLYFDGQSATNAWILYNTNGQYITSNNFNSDSEFWLNQGDYYLVMQGYSDVNNSTYSLRLITPDVSTITPLAFNNAISGNIAEKGEQDNYTFTGAIGQQISFNFLDPGQYRSINAYLYSPSGSQIFSRWLSDQITTPITLTEAGKYTLRLDGSGENTDAHNFSLVDLGQVTSVNGLTGTPITLGNSVSGSINDVSQVDTYTFTGTVGQQLFYDALGSDYFRFRLFDPTGQEIFNVDNRSDRGSDGGLVLAMNGTYRLTLSERTGNYSFRLLDKADATVINLDTDITGTFDNGGLESDSYRFTLTDRSYLYFDGQLGNYDNAWILYGSGGQRITNKTFYQGQNSDSWNDAELWLESGDYWLILQGNKAESFTNGSNDYKLRIVTPQLNTALMTLGTTITGTIGEVGEQDTYTFDGTAGQQLFYDALGGDYLKFRFYDPTGRELFNVDSRNDRAPHDGLTLTMNGNYQVVIDRERDGIGSYSFRLLDKADATVISLDTDITGTFNNGGLESDSYRFTLTDRSYLYFDKQFGNYDNAWILYGPNGQYITHRTFYYDNYDGYNDAELWLDSGEYWLILQGNGAQPWFGNGSNDYQIRIVTPQFNTELMTLGTTISGSISEVGEQDTYTFAGTAGQQLFYDALGGDYLKFRFFDPTGRELFNVDSRNDRAPHDGLTLTMNGNYQVVIDGERDGIGSYGFRLLDKADATFISLDTDIAGTFDSGGLESDSYRFTLTDRSYLYFDGQLGNYDNAWILYGSNGQTITYRYFYQGQDNNSYNDAELWLESGDYWLILEGNGAESWTDGSNDYKLRIVTPQLTTNTYTIGTAIAANISEVGEQDTYTFTGEIGQQLFLDAFAGDPNISINLYSPTGRLLRNSDVRSDIGPDGGYTLNEAGIYSLVIDGVRDYTGNYGFRLLDKARATAIAFDQDIAGTFANSGLDSQTYRFTVTTDQYLYFDAQTGDSANQWILYGNGGQLITYTRLSNDQEFWLGKGEYLLVAQGNGGTNLNYQFRLVTPDLITNSLTLGSQVSGTIAEAGEQDTYTFTGSVGQQLFLDALVGNSNIKARLYSPSDTLVLDHNTGTDAIPFTLTEKGIYRVVIDASNNTIGDYNFILVDRATAENIIPNTLITGTLSTSNEAKVYKLSGKKGNQFTFDLIANSWDSRVNWKLYDPNNHLIATPSRNSPDFKVTLTSDGLYSLVIQGENTEAIDYSFNVIDNSVTGITSTGMRTAITSTITNAGDVSSYTFQASAGNLIWLDQFTTSTWEIRTRLKNPDGTYAFSDHDTRYDRGAIQLEQTGTYTLETFGYYSGTTGSWQFQIIDLIDDPTSSLFNPQPFNSIQEATLNSDTTTEIYQIEVIVGQTLFFNGIRGSNLNVDLIDPNGQTVFSQRNFDSNHSAVPTLTQEGIYYLVVSGQGGGNKDYSYQLINLAAGPQLTINLPVKRRLASGQQSAVYQVEGKANQTLFFDINQGSTSARIKVYDLNRQDILYDTYLHPSYNFELTLQKDGIYTVLIEGGNSNTPIDYNFQVSSSTTQSLNVLTPGDGESNDVDKAIAKFAVKVAVEDTQGAKAIQDFMIRLWPDPDNADPTIISVPETRHALTQPIYRYQLQSIDPDQDKLQYRLVQAPNGAFINKDTGELLWYLDSSVTAGSSYDFSVEVTDSRGGLDYQVFKVETFAQLGSIQGLAFEDLNRNGILDLDLVKGNNPDVFFVIEYSCAVSGGVVDWTKADLATAFSQSLTPVDQELGAILLLSEYLTKQGFGNTANIGILDGRGEVFDMDPSLSGIQTTTTPLADKNNNGILDIRESLHRPIYGSSPSAIVKAINLHEGLGLTGDLNVMFMTSGNFTTKPDEKYQIDEAKAAGVNISAFSFGFAAMPKVREIDQDATLITSTQQVYDIFTGNVLSKNFEFKFIDEPLLEDVLVYLDINNNGVLDADEPQQFTQKPDSTSSILDTSRYFFNFNNLLPGAYTVRQVVPEQYVETTPITGSFVDVVTDEQNTFKHFFGIAEKLNLSSNQAPVIISQAPTGSINIGEKLIYHVTTTDADLDPLLFDLSLAPEGMTIEPTLGIIVWQPTVEQIGTQPGVLLRVQDGKGGVTTQYFELSVTSPNTSPLFTSLVPDNAKAQSGKTFQFQATAIDADNDTLTYSFNNSTPNGITIDATTGLVTWTPDDTQLGANQFTIKVEDGKGGQAFQTVTLTVNPADNNQAPVFTSTPRTTNRIGSSYFYQVEATDPNGDALTYSLVNAPTGMTLENGLISWQSTGAQAGQQTVTIQASDGSLTTEQTYQITVSHQASNRAPVITSAPNLTTNIEQIYTYNLTGQDPDGDLVFWSLDQAPSGMVLDIQTGVLRWQPQSNQLGQQEVIVRLLDSYGDYSTQTFTLKVNGANSPANILSNPITRAAVNQAYTYTVVAVDPENSPLTYSLGRRPDGMTIDATGKVQWTPTQVGSYDIDVSVTDNQGATTTQTYRLEVGNTDINRAPNINSTPGFVVNVGSAYQYQIEASDPDGQTLLYQLLQSPQGMTIDAAIGLLSWTTPVNGNYQVVVAVFDSEGLGVTQGYTLTARTNSLPIIRSTPKLEAVPNQTYRYDLQAVDPDGDSLSYSLDTTSQALGMILDAQGRLTWTPNNSQLGDHAVTLTAIDGAGGTTQQTFTLKVTADTTVPQVRINRSLSLINQGETVSFQVVATDNVGIANLQLLINDAPVVIDSNGVASFTATTTGVITAKAVALDAAGNRGEATTTVNVLDPTDTEAPTVSLDLSGIVNGEITAPVEIKGSVNDTNLDYYALEVAPADGSQPFKEMFRGTSTVNNGVLGVLDPTLLPNDTYQVRLVAYDVNGAGNGVSELLDVKGDLKLGNFQLSFTDLEIPVSGIPITLTRTYDTLTSNSQEDFGYGWRMEFRNASVRTSLPKDELYEELGIRGVGFKEGDSVYVTLPGGKRERFTFKLQEMKVMGIPLSAFLGRSTLYQPTFVADQGSTSTLSVDTAGIVLIKGEGHRVIPFSGGSAYSYYNPQDWGNTYTLTTKEGIVYDINATTGDINTITNRNGDVLNFSDGGIVSSNGQQVTFERDAQGRIVAAIDPMGNRVGYQYDANGDLVKVTDRENNTTTFEYNGQQAHYLDKIIDPLGKTGVRNEYDENGRLTKVFNALGNSVQLEYNPDNSLYTTKDALGNATTYEYDVRGNVVTEVDAKGGITRRTYDEDNNQLSETNPEGETNSSTYDSSGNKLTETDALGNVTRYTYNAKGDLLSTTDALGNTVTNTYDSNGNPTAISGLANGPINLTYGAGGLLTTLTTAEGITTYEYDGRGNVTKEIDPLGHETTYTYDGNGNRLTETRKLTTSAGIKTLVTTTEYNAKGDVIKVTDALGNVTQMAYDANGQKTQEIDALGRVTKYVYSDGGQLLETIYADATPNNDSDNPRTRKEYDAANRVIAEIDELGRRTEFQYDALGRLTFTLFPDLTPNDASDNPRKESRYDGAGRVIAEVDERGNITRYEYDGLGRRTKTILPDGTANDDSDNPQIVVTYDALGRQLTQVDPLGRTTQYLYDSLGRSTGQIFADQTNISTTYDLAGRVVGKTDQMGNKTQYEYNAVGQLTAVIDALNQRTEYQYNELGNLISQKDALGNITRYEYDGLGRRIATDLPLGQEATMTYDAVGNVLSTTDFNGETIHFEYDERNRLLSRIFPDNSRVAYTYTLTGQRATETSSLGTITYSYDVRNNLLSRVDADGVKIEYSYDAANNRTAVKVPSGQTSYSFDEQNRLKTVTDPQAGVTTYTYDLAGNLIKTTLANGTTETREYDLLNRLLYLQNSNSNGVINSFRYTLDKVGNRLAIVEQDGRRSNYEYDALYRLLQEEIIAGTTRTISYTYDVVSNRLTRNDSLEGNTSYEYDGNDRLLKEMTNGVTTTYTYDNNGNTLTKTVGTAKTTYEWDVENRLVGADTDGDGVNDVTNEYDGDGIRIRQTVAGEETHFLVDKNRDYAQVLEEYTPSKIIKASYIYGHDLISQLRNTERSFYHVDGLGSTRALTDINGFLTDAYAYEAFGEIIKQLGNTQNSYLFAGEQRDPNLGLDYLRARYLDVNSGRFYGRDPFEGILTIPNSLHPYIYANNNSVNLIDPSGFTTLIELLQGQNIYSDLRSKEAGISFQFVKKAGCYVIEAFVEEAITSGIYVFIDRDGLIYTGKSKNMNNRFKQHLKSRLDTIDDVMLKFKLPNNGPKVRSAFEGLILETVIELTDGLVSNKIAAVSGKNAKVRKLMKQFKLC